MSEPRSDTPSGTPTSAERLREAFEHFSEPVTLADAEDRIVFANRAFRAINPGLERHLEPGRPYLEHVAAGLAAGLFPDKSADPQAWLEERREIRRRGGEFEIRRSNGRWLLVRDERLPDGATLTVCLDITRRKEAEAALRASEERFRHLTHLSADWYWEQDAELRFTFFAGPRADPNARGSDPSVYLGKRRWELGDLEPLDTTWEAHRAQLERREPFREVRFRRAMEDGSARYLSVSGDPVYDREGRFAGYRGVARDITAETLAEQHARQAAEELRLLADSVPAMIAYYDRDLRLRYANRQHAEFYGYSLGRHMREVIGEDGWQEIQPHLERLGAGEDVRYERTVHRPERAPVEIEVSFVRRRDAAGALAGFYVMVADITARKRAESAIRELNEVLEQRVRERTAELEAALAELEEFSYTVSHDLRAPARAAAGFARMLLEEEGARLSEEGRRQLERVERSALHMGRLVDGLLALARVSRAPLRRATVDLAALAQALGAEFARRYPRTEFTLGVSPPANGDLALVRELLAQLLDNAFKYSSGAAAPRVQVGWDGAERAWFVRDNGAGFDMAHAAKLFRPFERLHPEGEFEGIGIGLAIARRIVERHRGRIWAEAAPGAGATFRFTLPG